MALTDADSHAGEEYPGSKKLKVLVIGAHPDDPENTCGGTLIRYAQSGHDVVVVYLTRGEEGLPGKSHQEAADIRTKEALKACEIMTARPVFAGQIDGHAEFTLKHCADLKTIFDREKPDLVFTHWPVDNHPDHRVCSILVHDVLRKSRYSFALYYQENARIQTQLFHPTHYVDIGATVDLSSIPGAE